MRVLFLLVLIVFIQGCQYDPHAQLYTTEKPQLSNIVGRYTLTSQSVTRDGLSVMQGRACVIELRADGTFSATNVPPVLLNHSPDANFFSTLVSGSGTWAIAAVGSVGDGTTVKTHWGVDLDSTAANFLPVGLIGRKPPYGLIYTLGDPDEGMALILDKN